jgi:basic membrane protein A
VRLSHLLGAVFLLLVLLLVAGELVAPARDPGPRADVVVGLVFDVGGRGDKSFNDSAWRGLVEARDTLGVSIQAIEPGDGSDREFALRHLAAGGADLVIGVGFIFSRDLDRLAAEFPEVAFAGIDYAPDDKIPIAPNLLPLLFREEEGSFVVGAIAGMVSETGTVGFVGGMEIPLIRKFEAGYAAGVRHVCPTCKVLPGLYAGSTPAAFADPAKGQEMAVTLYDKGADVLFHASGKTGSGVFAVARERARWAIGVDADQYDEAPCCVLTSMLKRVDVAVVDAVRAVIDGSFRGGAIQVLGIAEEGVGFVSDERNADRLPAEVVERARAIAARVAAGEIEVPTR